MAISFSHICIHCHFRCTLCRAWFAFCFSESRRINAETLSYTSKTRTHADYASEQRVRLAFVVSWDSLWNITQMPGSCIGALLPSLLQPLWFHVPSWYETDGEGCTPLMPLCKGWCFRCDFATCGHWQRHTHHAGTDSYHLCWAQEDKLACTAAHTDCPH